MADTEDEIIERTRELWRRYSFLIVIFLAMVLSAIFGFTYQATSQENRRLYVSDIYYSLRTAVDGGDVETAKEYFSQLPTDDFLSIRRLAAFSLADGLYDNDQYDEAILLMEEVVATEVDDPGIKDLAVLRLGELYINAERFDDAIKLLSENFTEKKDNASSILFYERIGDAYYANGKNDEALAQYKKAILLSASYFRSYLLPLRIKISSLLSLK